MSQFAEEQKSEATYLDVAANGNGAEKVLMAATAVQRLNQPDVHLLEVGPGGGASVNSLCDHLEGAGDEGPNIQLTLMELEAVKSDSLDEARQRFSVFGSSELVTGNVVDLSDRFEPGSLDVVSLSAVLHEVYSYSGGYRGVNSSLRGISSALKPGGYFAYRDVFSVEAPSLHSEAIQSYHQQGWLRFIKLFMPHYLSNGQHPYHHDEDEIMVRQGARLVDAQDIKPSSDALLSGPVGVMREIQRHYVTFRDHVWRSGVLGFKPVLDGEGANDWMDIKNGHKRVHFTFSDSSFLNATQQSLLMSMSEQVGEHFVINGDIFDDVSDTALNNFLGVVEGGQDIETSMIWSNWLAREGSETYAYMTTDQLIGNMALRSVEASESGDGPSTILLPQDFTDVATMPRTYYNRFLRGSLSNPLYDGKQLILAKKFPLTDVEGISGALEVVQRHCSRQTIASLYSLINNQV